MVSVSARPCSRFEARPPHTTKATANELIQTIQPITRSFLIRFPATTTRTAWFQPRRRVLPARLEESAHRGRLRPLAAIAHHGSLRRADKCEFFDVISSGGSAPDDLTRLVL